MTSFELNSNLYTKPEIEDILSLKYPYTVENVEHQKKMLFKELSEDHMLQHENKTDLANFVKSIAGILVNDIVIKEESKLGRGVPEMKDVNSNSLFAQEAMSSSVFLKGSENSNTLYPTEEHDVIMNKKADKEASIALLNDGLHIDENGAPPGLINPLQYRTIKRAINIDSRFRPNYYASSSTDMQLTLPTRLEKVISMRLGALELPNTFYAISEELGNNCFQVETNGSPQSPFLVVIPDGNYTSSPVDTQYPSIASAITKAMENVPGGLSDFLVYTVDPASGRSVFSRNNEVTNSVPFTITFGVTRNSATQGEISSTQLPYFLGWQLGYRTNVYTSGGPSTGGSNTNNSSIVSEGQCQISGPRYLYLAIDDYNNNVNNYFVSAFSDSINSRNILSRIDLPNIKNEDGVGSQINRTRNYFGPVNIEKMQIRLMDEYGRIVNLNNMDWSFTLMFECMY